MKLDRAIEILEKEEEDTWMVSEREWKAAVKLGYEALKDIRKCRPPYYSKGTMLLPGETED